MGAFAIYRLPYESECRLVMQEKGMPEELLPEAMKFMASTGRAMIKRIEEMKAENG